MYKNYKFFLWRMPIVLLGGTEKTDDRIRFLWYSTRKLNIVLSSRGMRSMESGASPGESVTVKSASSGAESVRYMGEYGASAGTGSTS